MRKICKIVLILTGMMILSCLVCVHAEEYTGSNSASASILIEALTGNVLYAKNENTKLPMASTTKIMTSLITLSQPNLDEAFMVDPNAIKVEGSSMGLKEGDQVTLRSLAYGMLLPSGNDAANAAAVKIGGSVDAFVALMNQKAVSLGLGNTHFVTPSGLDANGHYSTAHDMAFLARAALQNKDFLGICSSSNAQVVFGNPPYSRWLKNSNKLLTSYRGAIGVKTGFTDAAGRCLVASAERNGVRLICVTLNDPNDWQDISNLFDYGFSQVQKTEIPESMLNEMNIHVVGGTKATCKVMAYGMATSIISPDKLTVKYYFDPFYYAPVRAGDIVGRVEYLYDNQVVAFQQLIASEPVSYQTELPQKNMFETFWDWVTDLF